MRNRVVVVTVAFATLVGFVGHETTPAQNGALQGGVLGAGVGASIGKQSGNAGGGALIGENNQEGGGTK